MSAVLHVDHDGEAIGTLTRRDGGIVFEAAREWLRSGPELSPIVPLRRPGPHRCNLPDLRGLHGLFYNSLPDMWGTRLMEVEYRSRDLPMPESLDRLAYVGRFGMGSLTFRPEWESFDRAAAEVLDIAETARQARHIEAHGGDASRMRDFFGGNGTAGGARPKINVRRLATGAFATEVSADLLGERGDAFILKFETVERIERVEYALMKLAAHAGLHVADVEQITEGERRHLLVRRFDRHGDRRFYCPTLYALTEGGYRSTDYADYLDFADAARVLRCGEKGAMEILRRALFGRMVGNTDDHHKNHSFILRDGVWALSPAYDITHTRGAIFAMRFVGRSELHDAGVTRSFTQLHNIPERDVVDIFRSFGDALRLWPELAASAGIGVDLADEMASMMSHHLQRMSDNPSSSKSPVKNTRVRN